VAILRPNTKEIDPYFLKYHLANPYTKQELRNYISGAAIPRVVLKDFRRYTFRVPDLVTQSKISRILKTYDDLIENNLRRIELLEQSAQLLYKEWFVHLRFPGYEHTKIVDGVPEGWELIELSKLVAINQESPPSNYYGDIEYRYCFR
jgi:type I restriction enzyme, S subunit